MRGAPVERVIRVGAVRYTGQRVRLVVVNELEPQPEQQGICLWPVARRLNRRTAFASRRMKRRCKTVRRRFF
jgi:hypothetical protein